MYLPHSRAGLLPSVVFSFNAIAYTRGRDSHFTLHANPHQAKVMSAHWAGAVRCSPRGETGPAESMRADCVHRVRPHSLKAQRAYHLLLCVVLDDLLFVL